MPTIYAIFTVAFVVLGYIWSPNAYPDTMIGYNQLWRISYRIGIVVMVAVLVIGFLNGRRSRSELERQQWLIVYIGGAVSIGGNLLIARLPEMLGSGFLAPTGWQPLAEIAFPLALGLAVMRYRLFDIGTLINRALVYSMLTACVVLLYALLVIGVGALLEREGDLWLSLLTTGVIAMLFQPLRTWLQRIVDRRMFGQREDPYQVLTYLSERLGAAQEARTTLLAAADSVARALNVPFVAIASTRGATEPAATLTQSGDSALAEAADLERLPLAYRGEIIGELRVAPRSPGEAFSAADERLMRDLAPTIAQAVNTARLTHDLQQSRQRVIGALEDERRRLRRDLHDSLGPTLATVMLNLDTLRSRLAKGAAPRDVDMLLTETRTLSEAALSDVRRVAYDLRPPALDDLGLVGALRQHAEWLSNQSDMLVEIHSELDNQPLPAAIEVAAYRITTEALVNAARHARAKRGEIHLQISHEQSEPTLVITIRDDGVGLPVNATMGVGLRGMRERVDELDGALSFEAVLPHGTLITAKLPLR
jgi:signal transduction histidine kinase